MHKLQSKSVGEKKKNSFAQASFAWQILCWMGKYFPFLIIVAYGTL